MRMKKKRIYDRDFKENAVRLSNQREDISSLSKELGITTKLLYSWRSEARKKGAESFPGRGNSAVTIEAKAEQSLKKEMERLRKENEILKKALGIISREED